MDPPISRHTYIHFNLVAYCILIRICFNGKLIYMRMFVDVHSSLMKNQRNWYFGLVDLQAKGTDGDITQHEGYLGLYDVRLLTFFKDVNKEIYCTYMGDCGGVVWCMAYMDLHS